MKPLALSHRAPDAGQRPGQRLRLILIFVLAALLGWTSGCATPTEKPDKGPDTIIGAPPTPEEDPYFIPAMPADAIPVAPSGELIDTPRDEEPPAGAPAAESPPAESTPEKPTEAESTEAETAPEKSPHKSTSAEKYPPQKPSTKSPAVEKPAPKHTDPKAVEPKPVEPKAVEPKTVEPKAVEPERQLAHQMTPKPAPTPPPPPAPKVPQCFSCVRICPAEGNCQESDEDIICGWGTHATASQARRVARAQCDATLDMARQMPVWSRIDGQCPPATCRD